MEINKEGKIFIGIVAVLAIALVALVYGETYKKGGDAEPQKASIGDLAITTSDGKLADVKVETEPVAVQPKKPTMNNNLQIVDEVVGTGAEAVAGKEVTVHYVGTFTSGKKFDSSRDRGTPFTFTLGASQVIKGWDLGVAGMKVGGKRKLTVPPELGYGASDYSTIPGGSTLLFEVELLGVK